jgi:hypothetical protein
VRNVELSIPFYRDVLGFTMRHHDGGFAIFHQDTVELHLWQADDESWRTRTKNEPVCSGAESFIAGTASCRIAMSSIQTPILVPRIGAHVSSASSTLIII